MPDEVAKATEVFLTGTAAEVTPVGEIDGHTFVPADITRQLMDDYEKAVGKSAGEGDAASAA
jgi:branched-chain amino acid aminotransferase